MQKALESWAREHWADDVTVDHVADLGGHSGCSYGFHVIGGSIDAQLVIRLAPAGVNPKGSADVLRQVPLLKALRAHGAPVAAVCDASDNARLFGVPFLVVERLPGRPLTMGPDAGPQWLPADSRQRAHGLAAQQLASLHTLDFASHLGDWERPRTPHEEIDFWRGPFERAPESDWTSAGASLREKLLASQPSAYTLGLCHGDFQTNNLLFDGVGDGLKISGIVDWEISHIGAVELDLAWFLMMNDSAAWHPVEQRGRLDLADIAETYERSSRRTLENLDWFWALACYRIAAIAALNIRLHRSGRRLDSAWERAALSVPFMLTRAQTLLQNAS